MNKAVFSKYLLDWYEEQGRDLPWAGERDPYKIWISEIILQQTRVAQGWDYYLRFLEKFPDLERLATAEEDEVMKLWQGLGYYSRARNLHKAAKVVYFQREGLWPRTFEELLALPGIGKYTAAAMASFAFAEAVPVVDGNVYRVLSRVFLIEDPIDHSAAFRKFFQLGHELMDASRPGIFNQAMMDFGALVCRPMQPLCSSCPMASICLAKREDRVQQLPFKAKKMVKKNKFLYFVSLREDEKFLLEKRVGRGIWQGLYQFPLIEALDPLSPEAVTLALEEKYGLKISSLSDAWDTRHELTHQSLYITIYKASVVAKRMQEAGIIPLILTDKPELFAFPKPLASFIEKKV
jgi:A/G-specific adenine glycosylase